MPDWGGNCGGERNIANKLSRCHQSVKNQSLCPFLLESSFFGGSTPG